MQKSLFRPLLRTFLHFLTSGNTSLVISIAKFEFSCKKTQVIFLASNDPRIWECHIYIFSWLFCYLQNCQFLHISSKTTTSFIHIIFHQFCLTVFISYLPLKNVVVLGQKWGENGKMWNVECVSWSVVTPGGSQPHLSKAFIVKIIRINFTIISA